jgi:hypothetical protein
MTGGESRLAQRLEAKPDDDYLLWYDVPVGPKALHSDFILLNPSRGLFVLEVKLVIPRVTIGVWQVGE